MKKLVLTGADEASYLTAHKQQSRLVAFPDGLVRHITLSAWQWNTLDWLERDIAFRAPGSTAADAYDSTALWCPASVLRAVKPLGWRKRPIIAFNDAARREPERASIVAFRDNAEDITSQGRLYFERRMREHIAASLKSVMYTRMGFRTSHTANDAAPRSVAARQRPQN
jgi:hypothetical protein